MPLVKYTQIQQKARSGFHCIQNKSEKHKIPFNAKYYAQLGFGAQEERRAGGKTADPHHQRLRNHTALFGNYLQAALQHQIKAASFKIETN